MWGTLFVGDPKKQETAFLAAALSRGVTDADLSHGEDILERLQCDVLLVNYYLHLGRILEARVRLAGAVELIFGAGLHLIRSASSTDSTGVMSFLAGDLGCDANRDWVREGEFIGGFWTVIGLRENLSCFLASSLQSSDVYGNSGCSVDTPWPLDMSGYEQVGFLTLCCLLRSIY
jgi:hypothetical protein